MKTDSIFYRLFQTFPESFFDLLNLPPETVNHYQFSSLEVKQLAFRLDGVFLPDNLNDPIYFVEVQFQKDERFYSRFFSEIFLYFHQSERNNNWQGVIIYPHREIENSPKSRYQEFFESGRVNCYYLNQLYHFSKVMTDLVDYSKAQFRSRTGIALLDVSHDY